MIRTRIAPSPTWCLHLGTARSALYNFLYARKNNWKFVLRIEDTDYERSTEENREDIKNWLRRLWLEWDEWPEKEGNMQSYNQSERQDIYNEYIQKLLDSGYAYYAWETPEELDQLREEAKKQKKQFIYRKRSYTQEEIQKFREEWRNPVIRLQVPSRTITFYDWVKKDVTFDMNEVSDFVIVKSDGVPTFYLANVIDDHLMGVTHILRWEDHIPNTPKQILIYEALGWQPPEYIHLPMLLNSNKSKMSKRDSANEYVTISKFKKEGFLPEALVNFIALLGWHPSDDREWFSLDELIKNFSADRINSSNAVYDFERALRFNSEYIKNLSDEDFVDKLRNYLQDFGDQEWQKILETTSYEYFLKVAPYIKIRLQTLGQFRDYSKYFFVYYPPSDEVVCSQKMKVTSDIVNDVLPEVINFLEDIDENNWTEENLKQSLIDYIKNKWYKNWQVLWPIRAILTWVEASPGAFEMLYILWKQESIRRLKEYQSSY